MIEPGSPVDLANAKINYHLAQVRWASSMTSEVFDGVVTFSTEDYLAAGDEYAAARRRYRDRCDREREHLANAPRRLAALANADTEATLYA